MACFAEKQLEIFGDFVASEIDAPNVRGDSESVVNRKYVVTPSPMSRTKPVPRPEANRLNNGSGAI